MSNTVNELYGIKNELHTLGDKFDKFTNAIHDHNSYIGTLATAISEFVAKIIEAKNGSIKIKKNNILKSKK